MYNYIIEKAKASALHTLPTYSLMSYRRFELFKLDLYYTLGE